MKISLGTKLTCKRCGKTWHPRKSVVRICPACKSHLWNTKRAS